MLKHFVDYREICQQGLYAFFTVVLPAVMFYGVKFRCNIKSEY